MLDLNRVKTQLEKQICKEHGGHPEITVNDMQVGIKCCCEEFEKELSDQMDKLISDQIDDQINDAFNSIGSGKV